MVGAVGVEGGGQTSERTQMCTAVGQEVGFSVLKT